MFLENILPHMLFYPLRMGLLKYIKYIYYYVTKLLRIRIGASTFNIITMTQPWQDFYMQPLSVFTDA